ncbi:hypothetical protein DFR72_103239 [Lentzea flaviverrucosa]|uniref:Uncharacterized protein n=1 Tax=Lentzea flaviverrucosa TaxID=200379 RepID=A0A1H9B9L4_9PSEU|nr:hypothetical protein DFR72_103239 [Lentzea flaviverrucosa]SEP85710.1 hypothetical protein SAMN05216195_101418 [Lentzea flaviverrucosa]
MLSLMRRHALVSIWLELGQLVRWCMWAWLENAMVEDFEDALPSTRVARPR